MKLVVGGLDRGIIKAGELVQDLPDMRTSGAADSPVPFHLRVTGSFRDTKETTT